MPLTNSPMECVFGIIMVATGIPVYMIAVMWKSKPKIVNSVLGSYNTFSSIYSTLLKSLEQTEEKKHTF